MNTKMKRNDLAYEELNTIFSIDPNNIPATIIYGEIKNSEGKYDEAEKCLQKVLDESFDLFMFKRIMERIKERK